MSNKDEINRYGVKPFKTNGPVDVSQTLKSFNQSVNSKINLGGGKGEASRLTIPKFSCPGGSCSVVGANSNSIVGNTAIVKAIAQAKNDHYVGGYKERSYKKKSRKKRIHKKKSPKKRVHKKKSPKWKSYKKKSRKAKSYKKKFYKQ
uniref:Uncharacterized protein n=1 Tax=viral metagenome TaxID=1070528 RepID=A0A6C0B023_9ZZZZ|tara:strand:+ start:65 stop:505 length:441 start_codon:yes stop_codon:yes gene_type:complete